MEKLNPRGFKTSRSIAEEVFNSTVHGLAAIASIIGLVYGIFIMSGSPMSVQVGFII